MDIEFERRYRVVASRDRRFEGAFLVAVTSTGVFCRVGCPSRTPRPENCRFFESSAAARAAGFRACLRCRPEEAGPAEGMPAARALALIAEGAVDRIGVAGVAAEVGVSERHLHRLLTAEVGSPPLRLAMSRRVQAARALIEGTGLPLTEIAFIAGFDSLRQFNHAMRSELGMPPSALRARGVADEALPAAPPARGWVTLRLARREPFDAASVLGFLAPRAIPGVEEAAGVYRRSLRVEGRPAILEITPEPRWVAVRVRVDHLAPLGEIVRRCRRLLDLDCDPHAVAAGLGADPFLAPLVAAAPGLRLPGAVDPFEIAVRAILGQQVSVAAARTLAGRLVARHGEPLADPVGAVTHLFPRPGALADSDLDGLGLTGRRVESIRRLAAAVANGRLDLRADPATVAAGLMELPGFGPWTVAYVRMRALSDPDAIPIGDLGLRRALERLGEPADAVALARRAERWRPWRAYAALHLWRNLSSSNPTFGREP